MTGGGRGIGRRHCLELARHGARVVVNDPGVSVRGEGDADAAAERPADDVVAEIVAAGGTAVADHSSVTSWDACAAMVARAVDEFGRLDVLVNNAGILRDRMITSMTEEDFDLVLGVHLKGTFSMTKHACDYWRTVGKAGGENSARIVNTTSGAGMYGNVGQAAYAAAKAAIANLTLVDRTRDGPLRRHRERDLAGGGHPDDAERHPARGRPVGPHGPGQLVARGGVPGLGALGVADGSGVARGGQRRAPGSHVDARSGRVRRRVGRPARRRRAGRRHPPSLRHDAGRPRGAQRARPVVNSIPVDALVRHWQERIPFNRQCGIVVSRWDEHGVRMEVDDHDDLANGVGSMHGGVVATLVDTAANAAAVTLVRSRPVRRSRPCR